MAKPKTWIHPIHARGVRSPQFDGALGPLTDRRIDKYILQGKYGEDRQKALMEERKKKKRKVFFFEDVLKMILGR